MAYERIPYQGGGRQKKIPVPPSPERRKKGKIKKRRMNRDLTRRGCRRESTKWGGGGKGQ